MARTSGPPSNPAPGPPAYLVTPSGPARAAELAAGLEALARWGVEAHPTPLPGAPAGASAADPSPPYLAAPDAARAAQLRRAVADAAAGRGAVWMVRGGYGAVRALARAGDLFHALTPAPLWGFSDGTALVAAWDRAGWPAWLGPPITQLPRLDGASAARVRDAWFHGRVAPFDALRPLHPGAARGPLGGGNLCLLASLVGTPWAADLRGRVVILEDVGEAPYKVDRLFTQLRLAGALDGAVGLVLGHFTGVEPAQAAEIEAFFARQAAALGLPAAAGLPVGHGGRNAPLPMGPAAGYVATLEVGAAGPSAAPARLVVERAS